jgi:PhnB protein
MMRLQWMYAAGHGSRCRLQRDSQHVPTNSATLIRLARFPGSSHQASRRWTGLADDATVIVPLAPAQWSPLYGMLKDRYGVTWVVDVAAEYPAS